MLSQSQRVPAHVDDTAVRESLSTFSISPRHVQASLSRGLEPFASSMITSPLSMTMKSPSGAWQSRLNTKRSSLNSPRKPGPILQHFNEPDVSMDMLECSPVSPFESKKWTSLANTLRHGSTHAPSASAHEKMPAHIHGQATFGSFAPADRSDTDGRMQGGDQRTKEIVSLRHVSTPKDMVHSDGGTGRRHTGSGSRTTPRQISPNVRIPRQIIRPSLRDPKLLF
jgi:hypothetical protein